MFKTKTLLKRGLIFVLLLAVCHCIFTVGLPTAFAADPVGITKADLKTTINSLLQIIGMINTFMHIMLLIFLNMLGYLLQADFLNDTGMMQSLNNIWTLSRNIMNVIFALMLIFVALYTALQNAIELKGSSFLWMKDLSTPDTVAVIAGLPINILPIIMGGTMVWQQKMSTVDPQQAKTMMLMPVFFTFIFYSFPSGLVLYWLVNNVLSILQQYQVQRQKT